MPKKNDSKAVDLHAQLQDSLAPAESAVVDAAVTFCGNGSDPQPFEMRPTNLLAIRAQRRRWDRALKPKPESTKS